MTKFIELTLADTNVNGVISGQKCYVNPMKISHLYRYPDINATVIIFGDGENFAHVSETPEEIIEMISPIVPFIKVDDEMISKELAKPRSVQVLPPEPQVNFQEEG